MKIFGSSPISNRRGEMLVSAEFSYYVPKENKSGQPRLEVDCFKRKKEHQRNNQCALGRKESFGVSDNDSDYGTMSHDFEEDILRQNSLLPKDSLPTVTQSQCQGFRVQLHPEEAWARNANRIWWDVEFNKYWKILCDVTECRAGGICIRSSEARMSRNGSEIMISGKFNRETSPEFQLTLSTSLTNDDRRRGYLYVGTLKQGRLGNLVSTHFAAVSLYQPSLRPELS